MAVRNYLGLLCAFAIWAFWIETSCGLQLFHHDPVKAGKAAETFVNKAVVERKYAKAAENSVFDESSIEAFVSRVHKDGERPLGVSANAYEPLQGTERIKVYVDGVSIFYNNFYYLVILTLNDKGDYVVSDVLRIESKERFAESTSRRSFAATLVR